jgi:DNA-binding transcriptional MerR regulator
MVNDPTSGRRNDPINTNDPAAQGLHTITDAIFLSGLSAQTLRRYEADRLIAPLRTARGTRLYRMSDLRLAQMIYNARKRRHGATGIRRALAPS